MNKIKMMNGSILTTKITKERQGLILPDSKNYKELKIEQSDTEINEHIIKDKIIYVPKTSGTDVEINGKYYTIINVREIILIV